MAVSKGLRRTNRRLFCEALEGRALMAADIGHNFLQPHDVNDDKLVTPSDALRIINHLNSQDDASGTETEFEDVNDDSRVTPLDALMVINDLNSKVAGGKSESSHLESASGARARLELEQQGTEIELDIRLDRAPAGQTFHVTLNDIALGELITDSRGRGRLSLGSGDDHTSDIPLPPGLLPLSADMELVIGDLVHGTLADLSGDDHASGGGSSGSGSGGSNSSSSSSAYAVTLPVVSGVQSNAEFEIETEHGVTKRKFEAEIEHAAPGATVKVIVAGIEVGSITADSKGKGKLVLSTNPKDASEGRMGADFPVVTEATEVQIGAAIGKFGKVR